MHTKRSRTHPEILAQRLCMICISAHSHWPVGSLAKKVFSAKVEERHLIAHRRLHIRDERHDVGDSNMVRIGCYTTTKNTAGPLDDPQVFSQRAAVQINSELLRPKLI